MSIVSAIFSLLDWAKDKLPIPNRLEKLKNQIDVLERERKELLRGKVDVKKSKRIGVIDARLELLHKRMLNAAPNS